MKITSVHHQNNNLSVINGCKSSYNIVYRLTCSAGREHLQSNVNSISV